MVSVGPGVPPAPERLLQVERHLEGQAVLQLPGADLQPHGQTFLAQTQRALGDRQPEDVEYTCRRYAWQIRPGGPDGDYGGDVLTGNKGSQIMCKRKLKRQSILPESKLLFQLLEDVLRIT